MERFFPNNLSNRFYRLDEKLQKADNLNTQSINKFNTNNHKNDEYVNELKVSFHNFQVRIKELESELNIAVSRAMTAEDYLSDLEYKLNIAISRAMNAEERVGELENNIREVIPIIQTEERIQEANNRVRQAEERARQAEERARKAELSIYELEARAFKAEKLINELINI